MTNVIRMINHLIVRSAEYPVNPSDKAYARFVKARIKKAEQSLGFFGGQLMGYGGRGGG